MPKSESRAKHWSVTINNWTEEDVQSIEHCKRQCKYMAFCEEVGKEGTNHLQGCVGFHVKLRMATLKKWFPRAHLEVAIDPPALWDYCLKHDETHVKDGFEVVHGEKPEGYTSGLMNNRWAKFQAECEAKDGRGWGELCHGFPDLIKSEGAMRKIYERCHVWTVGEKKVVCLWGDTGVGKSLYVKQKIGDQPFFRVTSKWFDFYDYEDIIWLDDFESGWAGGRSLFLQLLDQGACRVEVKGGTALCVATTIYITSNENPEGWFKGGEAIMRRMTTLHIEGDKKKIKCGPVQRQGNTMPAVEIQNRIEEIDNVLVPLVRSDAVLNID